MRTTPARLTPPSRTVSPAPEPLAAALVRLEARWGSAAIRLGGGAAPEERDEIPRTAGALALAPAVHPIPTVGEPPLPGETVSTGFAALDAVLAAGGLPRRASASLRGDASSGKTTLALRCVAEAQAAGSIVAWLDLPRAFDPLEAIARGVDPGWLVILRPLGAEEGFRLAGALLSGRAVDLLVLDLPPRLPVRHAALLRRLAAHARRVGARLLTLEPPALAESIHRSLGEGGGLRLELERQGWIRIGRDVVGQRTAVTVARDRGGAPGRSAELTIRYLEPGERSLALERLTAEGLPPATGWPGRSRSWLTAADPGPPGRSHPPPQPIPLRPPTIDRSRTADHAPAPSPLARSRPSSRRRPTAVAARPARAGRPSLGTRDGHRGRPGRDPPRGPPRTVAGGRPPAGA